MKKILVLWSVLLPASSFAQSPADDACWGSYIWNDDFTSMTKVLGLDGAYTIGDWIVANNFARAGEVPMFTENNVSIDGTKGMVITAQRQNYACIPPVVCPDAPYYYTAGSVSSWGARAIKYGYLEAKIKISDVYGLWPAFWTWSQVDALGGANYDYDEIDVFEMGPGRLESCTQHPGTFDNKVHTKYHMTSNIHNNLNGAEVGCTGLEDDRGRTTYINDYTQYHRYGVEWSPSKLLFYVDDVLVRNSPNPGYPADPAGNISQETSIILNVTLSHFVSWDVNSYYDETDVNATDYFIPSTYYGSNWNSSSVNTSTPEMVVESIKYYKLDVSGCNTTDVIMTSGNISSYDDKVKRDITTNGTISIPSGYSHDSWRAASSIIISGDFTVPLGSELYLDVNPCY